MVGGQTGPQSGKGLSSLGGTERDRAEGAWKIAKERSKEHWFKQYRNLVKGSASLVMSNGLISALAYYNTRSGATNDTKEAAKKLAEDIASFALPGYYILHHLLRSHNKMDLHKHLSTLYSLN